MKSDQEMKMWQLGGLNILQVLGCSFLEVLLKQICIGLAKKFIWF